MKHIEHARKMRPIIEKAVQSIDNNDALTVKTLYPNWAVGKSYEVGYKVKYDDNLYRCLQAHTAIEVWEPISAVSLWEQINETHSGLINDPIPYEGNMALENGKYYTQNGITYLCNRDTVNPVYNPLNELIGLYVEVTETI